MATLYVVNEKHGVFIKHCIDLLHSPINEKSSLVMSFSPKTIVQRCHHCDGLFRVRIFPSMENQRAFCPYCRSSHYYSQEMLAREVGATQPALQTAQTAQAGQARQVQKGERRYLQTLLYGKEIVLDAILRHRRLVLGVLFSLALSPILIIYSFDYPELYLKMPIEENYFPSGGSQPSIILDRNGQLIGEFIQKRKEHTPLAEIPQSLQDTLLYYEDRRFTSHRGIDWRAIVRALIQNVISFRYQQGGSTITQQMARIFLENRDKSFARKFREAALARYLEEHWSKEEILESYMNSVYLGHGAYGFSIAADFYFQKPLSELSVAEEFILAGLPPRPEVLSPLRNPNLLYKKIETTIREMSQDRKEILFSLEEEVQRTLASLNQSPSSTVYSDTENLTPYVTEHVRLFLQKHFPDAWKRQGLIIKTSIDRDMQKQNLELAKRYVIDKRETYVPATKIKSREKRNLLDAPEAGAEDAAVNRISQQEYQTKKKKIELTDKYREAMIREYPGVNLLHTLFGLSDNRATFPRLQTAFVGLENSSGQILFLVGGTEFSRYNQLNRVLQMYRQTGSSIKPIVYASGLQENIVNSASTLEDSPYYAAVANEDGKDSWLPDNFNQIFEGDLRLRDAFVRSKNIPAVRLAEKITVPVLKKYFSAFFFPSEANLERRFRPDLSIALGSLEMSPLEMASAYTVFANNGIIIRPTLIQSIEDASSGEEIYESNQIDEFELGITESKRKVLDGDVVEIMMSYLQDSLAVNGSSVSSLARQGLYGKTGTSNDSTDVWFVGGSVGMTTAVWLGFDSPRYRIRRGVGANLAMPLWTQIMAKGKKYQQGKVQFDPRATRVKICGDTLLEVNSKRVRMNNGNGVNGVNGVNSAKAVSKQEDLQRAQSEEAAQAWSLDSERPYSFLSFSSSSSPADANNHVVSENSLETQRSQSPSEAIYCPEGLLLNDLFRHDFSSKDWLARPTMPRNKGEQNSAKKEEGASALEYQPQFQ